jgi:hypothetical protein
MTEIKSLIDCEEGLNGAIQALKMAKYKVGQWYHLAKEACRQSEPKVKYKDWCEKFENEIPYSTAMRYRKVYRTCADHPEWVLTFSLSILEKLWAPDCPEDFRQYLFDNGRPDISIDDYNHVLQEYKAGNIDLHSPEMKAICHFDEKRDEFAERKKIDRSLEAELRNHRASAASMSEQVEETTLSEEGKRIVKESNEKIKEQIDIQLDTYKNQSDPPEFHLPKDK